MGADERRLLYEEPPLEEAPEDEQGTDDELEVGRFQALLQDRRRLVTGLLVVVVIVFGIYIVFPRIVGTEEALEKFDDAVWYWIVVALAFNVAAFAAYVALFRGILSGNVDDDVRRRLDHRASYQITMAGLAATRIFSAAGVGGIVLTYWALRKAGMPRRRSGCRMVAFIVLTYFVYLAAVIVFAILLRTHVLPGSAPLAGTIVPAAVAAAVIGVFLLIALIPKDVERRIQKYGQGYRHTRYLLRLARGPATIATGTRTAISYVRNPRRGVLAVGGRSGLLGGKHRRAVGGLRGLRRERALRRPRTGLLRRDGRQPDSVARGRRRISGRGNDRGIRALRHPDIDRLPGGPHLPCDRVLAADPAGDRRLLPAAPHGGAVGARA